MEWINLKETLPPQDGTPFLGFDNNVENEEKIYVLVFEPARRNSRISKDSITEEFYREAGGDRYFIYQPTHWMPLPAPPILNIDELL